MTANYNTAEQIYLEVYGEASENANYLQPSTGKDFILPDAIITALASTIIVALLQGFLQEAGKEIAILAKEWAFGRGKLHEVDTDTLIKVLESKLDQLKDNQEKLKSAEQQVEADLLSIGMAPEVAKRLAKRTVEVFLQHIDR